LGDLDLPFDSYWAEAAKQQIIQVDIDPSNIGVNRPITMGIVADARATLKAIIAELKRRKVKPFNGNRMKEYRAKQDEWWVEMMRPVNNYKGQKVHPVRSIEEARKIFPKEAINVADGGNTSLFNAMYSKFTKPRTALGNFEFGHLGTGIPQAIGAKLANPDKDVFVITGDGAIGFHIMELETAVREKTKITVLVHAEGSYSMVEVGQILYCGDPSKAVGCALHPVRWDKVAEGIGCHAEYVENIEQLPEAIKRAKASELPAVIHIQTDKVATLIPPMAKEFSDVITGA
jgi:acetolactate synthase-1/2/3 large subunit